MILFESEYELDEISLVAENIIKHIKIPSIILMHGTLGAGKTTLIATISNALNVKERVQSPTFNIHNTYKGYLKNKIVSIHHLDLYRLNQKEAAWDFDFTEEGNEDFVAFIEWPNKMGYDWNSLQYHLFEIYLKHPIKDPEISDRIRFIQFHDQT